MRTVFHFLPERCMACGACAVACMDQNDTDIAGGQTPLRHISYAEEGGKRVFLSLSCRHCDDAPCVKDCPVGCLYKDEETGLTLLEEEKCVGCRRCARACPYDAPTFVTVNGCVRMKKCDGCVERIRNGLEPACVRVCPVGALTLDLVP